MKIVATRLGIGTFSNVARTKGLKVSGPRYRRFRVPQLSVNRAATSIDMRIAYVTTIPPLPVSRPIEDCPVSPFKNPTFFPLETFNICYYIRNILCGDKFLSLITCISSIDSFFFFFLKENIRFIYQSV